MGIQEAGLCHDPAANPSRSGTGPQVGGQEPLVYPSSMDFIGFYDDDLKKGSTCLLVRMKSTDATVRTSLNDIINHINAK